MLTAILLLSVAVQTGPGPAFPVHGIVIDQAGLPLSNASVAAEGQGACETLTDRDGRFALPCADGAERLVVRAPGFHEQTVPVIGQRVDDPAPIVLAPMVYREEVVVTATRADDLPTSPAAPVTVVRSSDLALGPPVPVDDVLRAVPGFSLFRRSSSRVANPTTQGASLRGLAASGAGRMLVLADGVPVNDPFGGWAYWNRVPLAAIDRIEVVRGGASDLYGADALVGVVQILTARPARQSARVELSAAQRETGRASLFGGFARGGWDGTLAAEAATTDGYILVPEEDRGAVDTPAGGRHHVLRADGGYRWSGGPFVRLAGDVFGERRRNGTPLQTNSTDLRQVRAVAGGGLAGGEWRVSAQAGEQTYRQVFSAIADDRAGERLVLQQRVPASQHGGAVEWTRPTGAVSLLVGADTRATSATNHEQGYQFNGVPREPTATAAYQRTSGAFAQASARPAPNVSVTVGARGDLRQRDREEGWTGADGAVSPRVSAAWSPAAWATVRGSLGWSFRAPTLNERYRGFRVGNVQTLPNDALDPERLRAVEGSVLLTARGSSLRATLFRNDLTDAIANVTVSTSPQLILRRRENVGGVRAWGLELEGEHRLGSRATLVGSAAFLDSTFVDDPGLEGLDVPQVPAWQTALGIRGTGPWNLILAGQVRAFGRQYENDLNTLVLGAGAVVDLTAIKPLGRRTSAYVSIENLFDDDYDVGRTPVRTIGHPITAHVGIRVGIW